MAYSLIRNRGDYALLGSLMPGANFYRIENMLTGRCIAKFVVLRRGSRLEHDVPRHISKYSLADGAELHTFEREGR